MSSKVLVSLRVKAPADRAFDAFVGQIGAWWRPNPLFAFTPREDGTWVGSVSRHWSIDRPDPRGDEPERPGSIGQPDAHQHMRP